MCMFIYCTLSSYSHEASGADLHSIVYHKCFYHSFAEDEYHVLFKTYVDRSLL